MRGFFVIIIVIFFVPNKRTKPEIDHNNTDHMVLLIQCTECFFQYVPYTVRSVVSVFQRVDVLFVFVRCFFVVKMSFHNIGSCINILLFVVPDYKTKRERPLE